MSSKRNAENVDPPSGQKAAEEPPAKRGRGRPRSNKPKKEVDPNKPKRGRGRPKGSFKKEKKVEAKPQTNRQRGRPRKAANDDVDQKKGESS